MLWGLGGGGGLDTRRYPGLTSISSRSRGGVARGTKKYDNNVDKFNGDKVNGDVLQWRAVTRNFAALTLEGYNWELGRGAMLLWWAGWVEGRADRRCDSPPVLLSYIRKMEIQRVERGCDRKSSQSG